VGFRRFRLSGSAETIYHGDYIVDKGIGFARVQTPMGELDVYLLHTIARYQPDDQDYYHPHRVAQLFEAALYVNTISKGNPIIMLGDFNVRTDQLGYRLFTTMTGARNCYARAQS